MSTVEKLVDELSDEIDRAAHRHRLEVFLASREAGDTLTSDALRAGITLQAVIGAAADLSRYADEATAIIKEEYRPRLDCREGCSYCCCKPGVLTSVPELLNILHHVRSTGGPDAISALKDRADNYAASMEGRNFNDQTNESVPCPLLVEGRCSAYEVRPLTCRGYNSTDVEACRKAHDDTRELVPIFSVLKDVTDGTTVGAAQRLRAAGFNDALVDLGSALQIALTAGEGFQESVINGGRALSSAENSSFLTDLWTRVQETAQRVGTEIRPI